MEISSPRLVLAPLSADDTEALHRLWTSEPVRRFLWDDEVIPLATTRDLIEENEQRFAELGHGLWGLRRRDDAELIGFAGFWPFHEPPVLELIFGLAADHWGQGFAFEAATRVIRHGFEALAFERIAASTDVGNRPSQKLLDRLGMVRRRQAVVAGLDTLFYELERG
ncbi:MAG: GNAT family N-acetyltransferase [Acidobacteriota bacterium]